MKTTMLKFGKLSLVFALALVSLASWANTKGPKYLIGLQLYTVRDDCAKDFEGTIKAVSKMGFSGVEFAGFYGHSAEEIRKWLDEDHLKCYGSHAQLADLMGDKFEATAKFNKTLGNKLITVASLPGEMRNSREAVKKTASLFDQVANKLKAYGIMLAYHDHAGDFTTVDGEMFWDMFFDTAGPDVKIQFDTGNAMEAGQQAARYLTKYPGRVVSVHVKDHSTTNPNALLGEGDENWADVIPIWKGKNGPKWFIIEQEVYPVSPLDAAQKCLENFKKLMGI